LSVATTTTSATSPIGSETKNTQRQSAWSEIQPPVVGPMIDAKPKTAPVRPCQRPRSAGGMRSPIVATASGISAPAPRPWTARPATSWVIVPAVPQITAPSMKMTMPATKNGRRP
jgi:hypothetical protein